MRRTELNLFALSCPGNSSSQAQNAAVSLSCRAFCRHQHAQRLALRDLTQFPPLVGSLLLQAEDFQGPLSSRENWGAASQALGGIIYLFKNRRAAEQRYPALAHTGKPHKS